MAGLNKKNISSRGYWWFFFTTFDQSMTRQIEENVLAKFKGRTFSGHKLDALLRYPVLQMCLDFFLYNNTYFRILAIVPSADYVILAFHVTVRNI